MLDFSEILPEINGQVLWAHIRSIGIAYLLSLPIGYDRELGSQSAGLRTFPLVCVACCGYTLMAIYIFPTPDPQARMMQGLITGIGFIGGGAILKTDDHVSGLATASSMWVTGAIGMAVAWKRYEIAVLLSLITFLTLYFLKRAKKAVQTINEQ